MSKTIQERILTALFSMQLTVEALDGLEKQKIYRQTIPNFTKKLKQSLMSVIDTEEYEEIYFADEESFHTLLNSLEEISKWIVKQPFENVEALAEDMKNGDFKFIENE